MTYLLLKGLINDSYAKITADYVVRKTLGVDELFSNKQLLFVKCIFKVLMNQEGDESQDSLTKLDIQDCITLFNKFSGSTIPIEYT
jgi:hypothetical protein